MGSNAYKTEVIRQFEVFGAERMAMISRDEATSESTDALLLATGALVGEPGFSEQHGILSREVQRAIGRPLIVQVNPYNLSGFGSSETDTALATVYRLKNKDIRVLDPRGFLSIGDYESDETIYIDRDRVARVYKRYSPLYGNFFRDWAAKRNITVGASKRATETEVEEALDILIEAVQFDDIIRSL